MSRNVLQPFRYTMFIGRSGAASKTSVDLFVDDFESNEDVLIVDATGGHLQKSFKDAIKLARERQAIKYTVVHPLFSPDDARMNAIELSFICMPETLPALSLIAKRPTLKQVSKYTCTTINTYIHTYIHTHITR